MNSGMYKSDFAQSRRLVSILCVLCGLCLSIPAQDWQTAHPGVEYARVDHKIGDAPIKINLLRLDLTKVRLDVHHAFEKVIGVEPTSVIAARHNATAAINGGFFRLDKSEFAGDPAGLLMIDGHLLSESEKDRATLIVSNLKNETHAFFGHYATKTWIRVGEYDTPIALSGINRERKNGEAIIYDASLMRPQRQPGDLEVWLSKCTHREYDRRSSDRFIDCKDVQVIRDVAAIPKPQTPEFIISLEPTFVDSKAICERIGALDGGHKRKIVIGTRMNEDTNYFGFTDLVDVTNGVAQLIKDGKIDITWEQEKASKSFAEMRHPRTAVAKVKDGKFLMITVDGRQPGVSVGMTLQELAEYLLSLGATDAMNLDGGGSTTMFLDGKVVNTPSDKEGERKVSDAIVVTLRHNSRKSRR
ncbi:MAG: phosphodiester glycosidase family protein [Acidobacteriota bacterium]